MISIAETPPIIPALLFIETFVIMVNMVAMGTKIRVTNTPHERAFLKGRTIQHKNLRYCCPMTREAPKWTLLSKSSLKLETAVKFRSEGPRQANIPK